MSCTHASRAPTEELLTSRDITAATVLFYNAQQDSSHVEEKIILAITVCVHSQQVRAASWTVPFFSANISAHTLKIFEDPGTETAINNALWITQMDARMNIKQLFSQCLRCLLLENERLPSDSRALRVSFARAFQSRKIAGLMTRSSQWACCERRRELE